MLFSSIGHVETGVKAQTDTGWGSVKSRIVVDEKYQGGLKGLSSFSHIIVIYYLHEAKFSFEKHLVRKPQGREDMPSVGIFAQRAKDRPNPIGITAVELLKVKDSSLFVQGLDAIDGTPVLDIKPYFPRYDLKNAAVPGWVNLLMRDYF